MTYTIAIAGASGSGKSTVATTLIDRLNALRAGSAIALPLDAYYRDLSHLSFQQRDQENFDHPDALELELVAYHLSQLRSGIPVDVPIYDFKRHTRTDTTLPVPVSDVVVVEGILVLADTELARLYDLTVFVDAPLDICLQRRIDRDLLYRGRDEASVRRFWSERVLPMYQQFGVPAREQADIRIDGTAPVELSVAALMRTLDERCSR